MKHTNDKYVNYVEHPRYGRGPNYTGLNPDPYAPDVSLHWNSTSPREMVKRFQALTGHKWPYGDVRSYARETERIPNTAILADLSRQTRAAVPVTHYFDLERVCRDCGRPFIFFAEEQKYWYEELGFTLDADCVRCVECRKQQRGVTRKRERYEELSHTQTRTDEENIEMAECCLSLIESSTFSVRQLDRVRMLLNIIRRHGVDTHNTEYDQLLARVRLLESQNAEQSHAPGPATGPDSNGEP